jgi:mannose-6-phosphate isomerase-like protein (cupin superfamily)
MFDVTVKRLDELESYEGPAGPPGQFLYAGRSLGVKAWGMNVLKLPPNWTGYPEHDHTRDGQEEVYVVLQGSARLEAGGKSWQLESGTLVRVGSGQRRKLIPGDEGVTLLALGGTPGKAYDPPSRARQA